MLCDRLASRIFISLSLPLKLITTTPDVSPISGFIFSASRRSQSRGAVIADAALDANEDAVEMDDADDAKVGGGELRMVFHRRLDLNNLMVPRWRIDAKC